MDFIYYTSKILLVVAFVGVPVATLLLFVKPHLSTKVKYITKPLSQPKILLIGALVFAFSMTGLNGIVAVSEPGCAPRLDRGGDGVGCE